MQPFADDAAYLEAQLERLRLRLERAIALAAGKHEEAAALGQRAMTLGAQIAGRVQAGDRAGFLPGLERLRRKLSLDGLDADVILHAAASALDPAIGRLHTRLSGVPFHPWLDVGLAIAVQEDGVAARLRARARFQPEAPLVAERLIVLDRSRPEARDNLLACEIKLPPRVSQLVLGSDPTGGARTLGRRLQPSIALDDVVLTPELRAELDRLRSAAPQLASTLDAWGVRAHDPATATARGVTLLLTGAPGTGKTLLAHALAGELGRPLLTVDGAALLDPARAANLDGELDELVLEQRLSDAVLLIDDCEGALGRGASRLPGILRALDRATGLVLLATSRPDRLDPQVERRALHRLELEVPTAPLRERIWRLLLPPAVPCAGDVELPALAKRYDLTGGAIARATVYAVSRAVARGGDAALTRADLDAAAQAQLRGDLTAWAERTRAATLSLDALVLPADVKSHIEEIIAAGKNRGQVLYGWGFSEKLPTGKGLVVLLSGDPGTGKTLAAEVIAAELGLSLYRINPAKVVSKYVGETEKNLNEVLQQARATHAILFFDEADALFSTRVAKVESANDRFVNLETNFLLQQLERYEGIVILATNLETSIDPAFKRRIAYHVTIPFPKPADRERIWRALLPTRAPVGEVDFQHLGRRFELSGGHIKNAILRAAYTAARKGVAIDHALLAEAAEHECAAAGKLSYGA